MITRIRSSCLVALLAGFSTVFLAEVTAGPRQMGELCEEEAPSSESSDEEDETCAYGLDCVRAPLRRKCFPVRCAVEAVQKALDVTGWDMENYAQNMMDQAGITMASPMFRPFPSNDHLNVIDPESSDLKRFLEVTKNNPPPIDVITAFFDDCTGGFGFQGGEGFTRKLLQEEMKEYKMMKARGEISDDDTKVNLDELKKQLEDNSQPLSRNLKEEEIKGKKEEQEGATTIGESWTAQDAPAPAAVPIGPVPAPLQREAENHLRKKQQQDQDQRARKLQTTPSPSATPSASPSASTPAPTPTPPPYTFYYGAQWGLGALATYNGDVLWASNVNNIQTPQIAVLNNCFGAILGFDAGAGALVGFAFTGDLDLIVNGCKQMFPIFETGPFGLEVGFIDCDNPVAVLEINLGLSAGFSLPGYTACTTTQLI